MLFFGALSLSEDRGRSDEAAASSFVDSLFSSNCFLLAFARFPLPLLLASEELWLWIAIPLRASGNFFFEAAKVSKHTNCNLLNFN